MKSENALQIFSAFCFLVAICLALGFIYKNSDIKPKIKKAIARINFNKETDSEIKIDYNFPIALSGKTKNEIYRIRKEYVKKSIFANENYEPSEEVFGGIEDGKPWISLDICNENGHSKITGASEEARFIINPSVPVALEYPFLFEYDNEKWCNDKINAMIPLNISYKKSKNEITVLYKELPFHTHEYDFYQLNGLNARDLGYKYAYVDFIRSKNLPIFRNRNNIVRNVIEFTNYIHTGSSCKIEGGCNNGSPRQDYLEFEYPEYEKLIHGVIYIKLWKNKPFSHWVKADMSEKIIIRNY